jgi:hypothetical protein
MDVLDVRKTIVRNLIDPSVRAWVFRTKAIVIPLIFSLLAVFFCRQSFCEGQRMSLFLLTVEEFQERL